MNTPPPLPPGRSVPPPLPVKSSAPPLPPQPPPLPSRKPAPALPPKLPSPPPSGKPRADISDDFARKSKSLKIIFKVLATVVAVAALAALVAIAFPMYQNWRAPETPVTTSKAPSQTEAMAAAQDSTPEQGKTAPVMDCSTAFTDSDKMMQCAKLTGTIYSDDNGYLVRGSGPTSEAARTHAIDRVLEFDTIYNRVRGADDSVPQRVLARAKSARKDITRKFEELETGKDGSKVWILARITLDANKLDEIFKDEMNLAEREWKLQAQPATTTAAQDSPSRPDQPKPTEEKVQTPSTNQPGFDCAKARTWVEKTICNDAELSRLDAEMTAVYLKTLRSLGEPAMFREAQTAWRKKERDTCRSVECLQLAYTTRLQNLNPEASLIALDANKIDGFFKDERDLAERQRKSQDPNAAIACDASKSENDAVICGNARLRKYATDIANGLADALPNAPAYLGDLAADQQEWIKLRDLICNIRSTSLESCLSDLLSMRLLAISSLKRPMIDNGNDMEWFWRKNQWGIETALASLTKSGVLDDIASHHEVPVENLEQLTGKIDGYSQCLGVGFHAICLFRGLHMPDFIVMVDDSANRTFPEIYQFQGNHWQYVTSDEFKLNQDLVRKHLLE